MYNIDVDSSIIYSIKPNHQNQKGRSAGYYKKNPKSEDIDRSFLSVVPDAPRIAEQGFPLSFDWKFLPPKFFTNAALKGAMSEFHLNQIGVAPNGLKSSVSAFEILSRSNTNLEDTFDEEEESFEKLEQEAEYAEQQHQVVVDRLERPKTYK